MRICSLLPSATEIVFSLGLGDQLVAVTHECDFPEQAARLSRITRSLIDHSGNSSQEIHTHIAARVHQGSSIYQLDQELLQQLDPQLVLTQELCDVCAVSYKVVEKAVRLLAGDRQVLSLEPTRLAGILDTIQQVGRRTGVTGPAGELVRGLQERMERVRRRVESVDVRPRVLALEWLDPPFVAGHWVPEMVELAGGADGLGRTGVPSFVTSWERIAEYQPQVVVAMPCGFDLDRTLREIQEDLFREQWRHLPGQPQLFAVNGSAYFNRPGPRIVEGLEMLGEILQPHIFDPRPSAGRWQRLD